METSNMEGWLQLGVSPVLIKALLEQKYYTPTLIQTLSIPSAIFGNKDILGAAETGSGKTLAFGIPILNGIIELKKQYDKTVASTSGIFKETDQFETFYSKSNSNNNEDNNILYNDNNNRRTTTTLNELNENVGLVQVINNVLLEKNNNQQSRNPLYALILTPTRELAIQIRNHLIKVAKYTNIKIAVIMGGMAAVKQERLLGESPEIVIATPGRLWELIDKENSHLSKIASIRYLVIDETDRMLERGHFKELHNIIERINAKKSRFMKIFVFSATLTLIHDIPEYLQRKKVKNIKSKIFKLTPGQKLHRVIEMLNIKNPKIIDITKNTGTPDTLTECKIACTIDHKDYYLYYFLQRYSGRTLVFCNSIGCVKRLTTLLGILNCNPLPLHASMPQRHRLKNLERFQANDHALLIATDVAARGLDIPNIENVIHYQVPKTSESYVHRSGRTARAKKEGITVLIMESSEKQLYSRLCKTLNRTEDLPNFPIIDRLLIAVKERVNVAREIDKLQLTYRRDNFHNGWLQKAAKEMDILLDNDEFSGIDTKEKLEFRRILNAKRNHLNNLMKKSLFPKNFSGKYLNTALEISLCQNSQKAIEVMKNALDKCSKSNNQSILKLRQDELTLKRELECNKIKDIKKRKVE
ncbi:ATP-dependent RNA helicase DDX24 isoform X2 [Phymastichus coffea]|uniref:ATP-dependent RNA helicase DDX24 isoform X2 n=1 Tax=Phymastichus coffea TaxID=108790 RepID=UPI00273B304E|nr:ATP-dependent RNA helicase DDX24 isoform X2 [Phymastichus coffea]